jgi:ABC-type Fe3+/spermidine/putrescine transport system ATPase subunit
MAIVPAHRRRFSLMFQEYALFPHKDVGGNVAFGLRMQARPPAEIEARVSEMLALVELRGYERRRVSELSGGEQQRVALARSLAPDPRLLLLDEPLGALDRALREQLMNDLRAILKRVGVTALYVTHDQEEAFAIADRVLIMQTRPEAGEGGRVVQAGSPQDVYRYPATSYVARFLGFRNLFPCTVLGFLPASPGFPQIHDANASRPCGAWGGAERAAGQCLVDSPLGRLLVGDVAVAREIGAQAVVLIRPEAATVRPIEAAASEPNTVVGRLVDCSFRGSFYLLRTVHAGGVEMTCEVSTIRGDIPEIGAVLALHLDPCAITLVVA